MQKSRQHTVKRVKTVHRQCRVLAIQVLSVYHCVTEILCYQTALFGTVFDCVTEILLATMGAPNCPVRPGKYKL